jgi:hypothetical protein
MENLRLADSLRRKKESLTFISNHLTYADSHVIEVLLRRFKMSRLEKIDRSHESVCQNNEIITICLSRPTTKWVRMPADADFACYPMTPRFKHDQRVSRLRNYLKRFAPLTPKKQLCQICAIKKPQRETKSRNQIQTKTNKRKNADQKLFSSFRTG